MDKNTLAIIRIVKNYSVKEMADIFLVTPAYINAIEKGERKMNVRTLRSGLRQLNITLEDYSELEVFKEELKKIDVPDEKIYQFMLIKAIGVINHQLKEEAENSLKQFLEKYISMQQLNITNQKNEKSIM